jgi:hypothetical protein
MQMPGILSSSIATPLDSVEKPVAMNPFGTSGASHSALNTPRMGSDQIGPDNTPNIASNVSEMAAAGDRVRAGHNWHDPELYIDESDKAPEIIPDEIDLNTIHVFDKSTEYDHWLDECNPWHPDLHRRLFPSQVIGFRWMCDRHNQGGGLVADVVGCGKV